MWRDPLTLSYTFSYGPTQATPAAFCSFFSVCTPECGPRRSSGGRSRSWGCAPRRVAGEQPGGAGRGATCTRARWRGARSLIGSSEFQQFTRFAVEGRWYRTLAPDVVLATRVRGGVVFGGAARTTRRAVNFVPVEQRFYGGGPNDVRGFPYNQLGPMVYVADSADLAESGGVDSLSTNDVQAFATGGNMRPSATSRCASRRRSCARRSGSPRSSTWAASGRRNAPGDAG